MNFNELVQKIENIKESLESLSGKDNIIGNVGFSGFRAKFTIPPPFNAQVRLTAKQMGLKINDQGIIFEAKSISKLDNVIDKIEEFDNLLSENVDPSLINKLLGNIDSNGEDDNDNKNNSDENSDNTINVEQEDPDIIQNQNGIDDSTIEGNSSIENDTEDQNDTITDNDSENYVDNESENNADNNSSDNVEDDTDTGLNIPEIDDEEIQTDSENDDSLTKELDSDNTTNPISEINESDDGTLQPSENLDDVENDNVSDENKDYFQGV